MNQYSDFAFVYDELMHDVDYDNWVKYIEDIIKSENVQVQNILELACGTGNLTRGYKFKNLFLSTLHQEDLNIITEAGYNPEAIIFKFDFLNDSLSKLPKELM